MKINLVSKIQTKLPSLFAILAVIVLVGCGGQGTGGTKGNTNPGGNAVSSASMNGGVQLPSKNPPKFEDDALDKIIPGYTSTISASKKSTGTTPSDPSPVTASDGHLKTIKIVNNEKFTIYAMVYQHGVNTPNEYRIYVNGNRGISGGCSASDYSRCTANVAIPEAMWDGGRVFISTEDLFSNPTFGVQGGVYTVDTNSNSINKGDIVYQSPVAYGVGLDSPTQLVEFTFNKYDPPFQDFVGYNISYVDHFYLPIAMEDLQGVTGGYLGTDSNLATADVQLSNFINGKYTCGYFSASASDCLGWAYFYTPSNNYLKIPGGYNYMLLKSAPSNFDNSLSMLVARKDASVASNANVVPSAIVNRWLGWVLTNKDGYHGPKLNDTQTSRLGVYARNCGSDDFCNKFAQTVTKLWTAGYAKLVEIDPATYGNITATDFVGMLMGYSFPIAFENNPPVIYTTNTGNQDSDRYKSSISYPEAVKSVLRGVPYPFNDYSERTQWYPDPRAVVDGQPNARQKYNLDPMVWFIHKKLNIGGYGFSIDDEISFVRVPQLSIADSKGSGAGLVISVGGLNGIPTKKPYNAFYQERLITGINYESGAVNWNTISDTLGLSKSCTVMPGSCNLAFIAGKSQSTTFTIGSDYGAVSFTMTNSRNESGIEVLNVDRGSCTVTGKLDKNAVCSGIFPSAINPWIVTTPPPIKSNGGGSGAYMLFFAPNWNSITSSNCILTGQNNIDLTKLNPNIGGAANINASNNCDFVLNGNGNTTVKFTLGVDTSKQQLTQVSNCTATKSGAVATCNIGTFNINGDRKQNLSIADPNGVVTAGGGDSGGGGGANTYMLYFGPEWKSISSATSGCTVSSNTPGVSMDRINGVPGASSINFSGKCSVNLKGMHGSMFSLLIDPTAGLPVACRNINSNTACTTFNVTGHNINLPPPSGLK